MYGMYSGYSMGCPSRNTGYTMEMKRGNNASKASGVKKPQETKNDNNTTSSNGEEKQWDDRAKGERLRMGEGGWFDRGQMEFHGDGQDQIDFFKQQGHSALIDSMNSTEVEAFRAWTRGDFMIPSTAAEIYGYRRMSSETKQLLKIYDKFLDKAQLNQAIRVVRRSDAQLLLGKDNKTATLAQLKALEGGIIHSKAPMSTAAAYEGLDIGSAKQIEYVMHIPKSTGAGMWVGHNKINGWGARQREFMVNRGSIWRVGKTVYDSTHDTYRVELYWQGRDTKRK